MGIGLTICPEISIQPEIKLNELAVLKWENETVETSVIMIWHAQKWCSPLLKQFLSLAEKYISEK